MFRADAALDAAGVAAGFTEGAAFQIGSLPPARGRGAIQGMLEGFFAASPFVSLQHRLAEVYDLDEALLWRAEAVYRMPDGAEIATPYVNRVRFEGAACADYRVHLDLSAVPRG